MPALDNRHIDYFEIYKIAKDIVSIAEECTTDPSLRNRYKDRITAKAFMIHDMYQQWLNDNMLNARNK
jgi:hypothetical protein